ncbi:MAG TPA: SDR family oxidoreductase, partial [Gemmatimonadales bacterium]|nr:SDR family oxidoreductase [Gemmatimonadales bacterium]
PIVADVSDRAEVRRVVREAIAALGAVDVWVNNVGQGITRAPTLLTAEDVGTMVRLNVLTSLYGMQEILPHFAERGKGQVINISSMLGRKPYVPFRSAYTGAKHFLNALTDSFRSELRESHPGITVTLVSPGVVRTEFGIRALHGGPDSRTLPFSQSAEEVAEVIAAVVGTTRTDVYTRPGAQAEIAAYYAGLGEDP